MIYSKITIPQFNLYSPTSLSGKLSECEKYKISPNNESKFQSDLFYHMPLIVSEDGSMWEDACLYLMGKLEAFEQQHPSTLSSIADSLKDFGNYCERESVNYRICTRRTNSPVRKYQGHLLEKIKKRELAASTVKTRLGQVIQFIKYLIEVQIVDYKYSPWNEKEVLVYLPDYGQGGLIKKTKTTDIQQSIKGGTSTKSKRRSAGFSGKIVDGGDLRPLSEQEQLILLEALNDLDNYEMKLIFLMGILTGARLQTILTLQRDNFAYNPSITETEVVIPVGRFNHHSNDLVDTKSDKSMDIFIPVQLYLKIKSYLNSEKCLKRVSRSKKKLNDDLQYAFLSQQGNPLYLSKNDSLAGTYKQRPIGQAVTTFVSEKLKPLLIQRGFTNSFKFHDTRATYGMNLVNSMFSKIQTGKNVGASIDQVFTLVRVRMGGKKPPQSNKDINDIKIGKKMTRLKMKRLKYTKKLYIHLHQ